MLCILYTDGQHKLVRWRLVVHAAIDGYSRNLLFIKCSSNNKAATMYSLFLGAASEYGLPSRIRIDQGGENTLVANHMLRYRGLGRHSVLVGSSVHNQRIEHLWRDSHRCSTCVYYQLFNHLEEEGLLNPLEEDQLFALHYVYIPKINNSLATFRNAWNNHGLRTESGKTPRQLFTSGVLQLRHSGLTALDFLDAVPEDYGLENSGFSSDISSTEGVSVPASTITPSEEQVEQLRSAVNPYAYCPNFGISQYVQALEIVKSWS